MRFSSTANAGAVIAVASVAGIGLVGWFIVTHLAAMFAFAVGVACGATARERWTGKRNAVVDGSDIPVINGTSGDETH